MCKNGSEYRVVDFVNHRNSDCVCSFFHFFNLIIFEAILRSIAELNAPEVESLGE